MGDSSDATNEGAVSVDQGTMVDALNEVSTVNSVNVGEMMRQMALMNETLSRLTFEIQQLRRDNDGLRKENGRLSRLMTDRLPDDENVDSQSRNGARKRAKRQQLHTSGSNATDDLAGDISSGSLLNYFSPLQPRGQSTVFRNDLDSTRMQYEDRSNENGDAAVRRQNNDERPGVNGDATAHQQNNDITGEWTTVTTKSQRKRGDRTAGKQKVTPIQLESMDSAKLMTLSAGLAKVARKNEMYVHQLGGNGPPRIVCESKETKSVVIDHLRVAGVQFNTYNDKDTRRKAFIVRGLVYEDAAESIRLTRQAALDMGVAGEISVKPFQTPYQRMHPSANRTPLYSITVPAGVDDAMLLDVQSIGYCRVRVEKMKKSSVVQCRRCQRLHHVAGQCNFTYRCVQCTTGHAWGECPRAGNPNLPLGCVNCLDANLNSNDHTANDLVNCNFFKKLTERQQNARQQQLSQGAARLPGATDRSNNTTKNNMNVSAKPITTNNTAPNPRSAGPPGYADVLKNGTGGLTTAQISDLVTKMVKSVLASLINGS